MLGVFFVYVCVMMALSDSCSIMACFRLVVFPVIPLAFAYSVLNRLVQFNVIRRYVKTNSVHTTHRLNALAAPPGIRV